MTTMTVRTRRWLGAGALAVGSVTLAAGTGAAAPTLVLVKVGSAAGPVALVARTGDDALYVVEQRGVVRTLADPKPLLDVRTQVSNDNEQGLLGLAFSLDGKTAYVDLTNRKGDTEIRAYGFDGVAFTTPKVLLKVDQPYPNHNGGSLVVDRDGVLWIGMGDGGAGGDPQANGQNRRTLLGKILRIDPRPSGNKPYGIPSGNLTNGRAEIWAIGLRNPWRFSIDQKTRTVWIGDVGQNQYEEIDSVLAATMGANFGWNTREGRHSYDGGRQAVSPLTQPVYEYSHRDGCSVTGGYVYRGSRIPSLVGTYVFADYCKGDLKGVRNKSAKSLDLHANQVTSFGVDNADELYVVSREGPIYRIDPAA